MWRRQHPATPPATALGPRAVALPPVSSTVPPEVQPPRHSIARTTAACLLWGQGLALLVLAGVLLPSVMDIATAGSRLSGIATMLLVAASVGAAALLVGTGLRRSLRGARAAGLAVQVVLLAAALQSHRPVLIAVVAAVTVVTGAVLLSPALVAVTPAAGGSARRPSGTAPPDSERAPGD